MNFDTAYRSFAGAVLHGNSISENMRRAAFASSEMMEDYIFVMVEERSFRAA